MGSVDYTREEAVAVLTINSPEVRNGLTPEMSKQLLAICDEIDTDTTVGAAVVRGAGGTFCSGADRRRWQPGADQADAAVYEATGLIYAAFVRVGNLAVPSVAAVQGAAVGAGLNLMLATDLRVVAHDARILAGFLKIGLHPGGGFFTIADRAMGREATSAMGLFSEEISGDRAVEIGLAWTAADAEEVDDVALTLATRAAADPLLAREAVRSFRAETAGSAMDWPTALHFERATQMWSQRRRNAQ
jgi:enoyl-CoA hydratase